MEIQTIKETLMDDIPKLIELLDNCGFANIKEHEKYISFGRDDESSPKSIVIRKENNDYLYVTDYARDYSGDLISFIIQEKDMEFEEVMIEIKRVIGMAIHDIKKKKRKNFAFNGFYHTKKVKQSVEPSTISDEILNQYSYIGNKRFLLDNIDLKTQKRFKIHYSFMDNSIIIPIYREDGELMGIKARLNKDVESGELKYFYPYPCEMSKTLFGYSTNYKYLANAESILVFEAEKSVMQAYGYGVRNCVAIGSSTLSRKQCKLLGALNSPRIILMLDKGLDQSVIAKNVESLKRYNPMKELQVFIWNPDDSIPDKYSPTDLGETEFKKALNEVDEWIG